ncbi:hypothetical protein MA16_Dca006998 [Dendrobium catenatum]|uniref:Uncharacterized protein n=1 Tax=Dendrobium catenatum TaxID=906689 RepID=A0A2I0VX25_9ASPA|nr:hypothetical protein MA16_Dca006998 [Dendrobium catenatum]
MGKIPSLTGSLRMFNEKGNNFSNTKEFQASFSKSLSCTLSSEEFHAKIGDFRLGRILAGGREQERVGGGGVIRVYGYRVCGGDVGEEGE